MGAFIAGTRAVVEIADDIRLLGMTGTIERLRGTNAAEFRTDDGRLWMVYLADLVSI